MIGQATAVEQARAVAEVQGAIVVAQQCPRSSPTPSPQMRESCAQKGLAERAFFRYSRGGGQITGPSVHLARELARCWGNMQYGIAELRRDDAKGESEMQPSRGTCRPTPAPPPRSSSSTAATPRTARRP
jgi:hypothetical protein